MAATNTHSSYKETGFTVITLPITARFLPPPPPPPKNIKIKGNKKKLMQWKQTKDTNKRELKSNRTLSYKCFWALSCVCQISKTSIDPL